jgi:queuine tRNA-ribosyltransferase
MEKSIKTKHGKLSIPFFMPDATRALVKFLSVDEVKGAGIGALVVNTLHLYLEPGMKIIKKAGGVHKFMDWDGPLLSDSGGYQVFSLIHKNPKMGKIDDKGAVFKSPSDGSMHTLTPEKSIQIQFDLGVDMMVCLDDCPPNEFSREQIEAAIERTIKWAARCKAEFNKQIKKRKIKKTDRPLLFAVVQGGQYPELREDCAKRLMKIGFDGYGFGGRHFDKDGIFLEEALKAVLKPLPENALKFALGIGSPEDIVRCRKMGWEMFDCVMPTREGRHGKLFYSTAGKKVGQKDFYHTINIGNSRFATDFSPINSKSKIKELRRHTMAYLHHLFKINDPLGSRLASLNNLEFYSDLMKKLK